MFAASKSNYKTEVKMAATLKEVILLLLICTANPQSTVGVCSSNEEGISTSSGDLDLQQDMTAVRNDRTGDWSVQLTCGNFTSLGHPPVDVVWTTPANGTHQSTNYRSGNFHLILPSPVKGGNYSCAIAPQSPAASCLPRSSPLLRMAVVNVDEYGARLTLLEARQVDLLAGNLLQSETNANISSYIHHLENRDANLTRQIHSLTSQVATLTSQIHRLRSDSACGEINYTVLRESWRAVSGDFSLTLLQCDNRLPAGWYRFKLNGANAVMPTSCVPQFHCGALNPVWLDLQGKSLPPVGQQVQVRTCTTHSPNCCASSRPAIVRNCGTFYVYNLQPPNYCPRAFCATSN